MLGFAIFAHNALQAVSNARIVRLVLDVKLQPTISIISRINASYVLNLIPTASSAVISTNAVSAEGKDSILLEVSAKNVLMLSKAAKFVIIHRSALNVYQESTILKMENVSAAKLLITADYAQPITPAISASKISSQKEECAYNVQILSLNASVVIPRKNVLAVQMATLSMIAINVPAVACPSLNV